MIVLKRRLVLITGLLWAVGAHAQAPAPAASASMAASSRPAEVSTELPGAKLLGAGRLRFLGLRVYEARLWVSAPAMAADWAAAPLALELEYARSLSGVRIAERSLSEMERQGEIEPAKAQRWLSAMKQIFPDVDASDRITGVNVPGMGARFFINSRLKGDLRDPEFARLFFGIWLSPKTSEPALREALLGKAP